jgi:octaprenyl-diphosphate synthase
MTLKEIKAPVEHHIEEFENQFRQSMKSKVPLLDKITRYIIKRKGKQMRPLFVFFTAELCGGITEKTYRAAALIELLHTATLVHDDVVDDSNERRGFFSLNALWKNKISVLVGDYLLSRGLLLSVENDDFELLKIVSRSVKQMSEGELLQLEKARNLDISEDIYFDIITKKTASLIASCFECGASSAGADHIMQEKLRLMGEHTGIAFQIKDDLLDYNGAGKTGKPSGGDIKERKLTLPLIYLLQKSSLLEKRAIINTVKNHGNDPEKVALLIEKVDKSGGIDYSRKMMKFHLDKAFEILESLPDIPSRNWLKNLVQFTIERES